jgi:Zn-dependent M28 family amino/carboxypeptidase
MKTFLLFTGFCLSGFIGTAQINQDSLLAHVRELASDAYEGRNTDTEGNKRAAAYITQRFEAIGLASFNDSSYIHPFQFHSRMMRQAYRANNILAYIPGKKYPAQYIVISAHYDHVGVRKDEIYNGADDNASGVGALIEIARQLQLAPLNHSVIFAAFDAEEIGLRGAQAFVEEPPVAIDSIILNVNMDMISRNAEKEVYICGTSYHPSLQQILIPLVKEDTLKVLFGHDAPKWKGIQDWTYSSDHGKFHKAGIPFLYFGVEDHDDYHRPTDDFDRIMPDFYHEVVSFILKSIKELDKNF